MSNRQNRSPQPRTREEVSSPPRECQNALPFWVTIGLLLFLGGQACERRAPVPAESVVRSVTQPSDQFIRLMNAGKNYLDQGDATNALTVFAKARSIAPGELDVHLNMANALLLSEAFPEAVRAADEALKIDPNSAAACFIKGSAYLHLSNWEGADIALENAKKIDPGETATFFQLGRAHMGLNQWEAAIAAFKEGLALDPNHLHTTAHYLLAQSLLRAGRQDEAQQELQQHQASLDAGGPVGSTAAFERCKYTQARVPFKLDQPEQQGIRVQFVDATQQIFGSAAPHFAGPIGIIDPKHSGWSGLFVVEKGAGFRFLSNSNGVFYPTEPPYAAPANAPYAKMLVGDLQNDRADDVIVLGAKGSRLFTFNTNGLATDESTPSQVEAVQATDGALLDLDFTGKLDLVTVQAATDAVQIHRRFGPLLFRDSSSASGVPASLQNARMVVMEDWNRDEIMDLIVSRKERPPLFLEKQRGGRLVPREMTNWAAGEIICTGDFDNDLRPDLAVVRDGQISICFNSGARQDIVIGPNARIRQLVAIDYDNDGWLDLWAIGDTLRAWRNRGALGFKEQTAELGLDKFDGGPVSEIHFADFDHDCDSDAVVVLANGGLRFLRNDGGNANGQVKVELMGNRSNASGLGCKVEIETGALRLIRTVQSLPVEVGVGKYQKLDSFLVHWANWPQGSADVPVNCQEPLLASELTLQEGSCPYLYAWNGNAFSFVTDVLGAAPLGLPVADGIFSEAHPEELVWIGNEQSFRARNAQFQVQITEELREVLYLDEVKLAVVDHPPSQEVYSTSKLLPAGPFAPDTIVPLHNEHPLRRAETLDGLDVTEELRALDGRRVSPPKRRVPQLRGLAQLHGLLLDFGPLDGQRPLVLILNGWIRFGGGMANIAAAEDPSLPFPFPKLEAEVAPGTWRDVDVVVGVPAGKTKTILVDLQGKLPPGTSRLRLTEAFELHWDRIALMEKEPQPAARVSLIAPRSADLHFRGFSALQKLPPDCPPTPGYEQVQSNSYWTIVPGGWCTRYGDVLELISARDEGLALINSGDELTVSFAVESLPAKPSGFVREYFLSLDGWDKDSDFHVRDGTTVEPLPFHGMHDQLYGQEQRPSYPSDVLHRKYNTRWVDSKALKVARKDRRPDALNRQ